MAKKSDHDRIAAKAHELWEAEGHPHGRDQDHWDQAREMIAIEDSQKDTLKPRRKGAKATVESAAATIRVQGDMPNLTDQGENLLTSTDREPDFLATPAGREGEMPSPEVPTSEQPGMPKGSKRKPAAPKATTDGAEAQPKTASVPKAAKGSDAKSAPAKPASAKSAPAKAPAAGKKGK